MKKLLTYSIILSLFASLTASAGLSQEELQRKSKYFLKWDADGDQKLNKTEFLEMTRVQFEKKGQDGYEEAARKRMKRKDVNKDGYMDWAEFLEVPGAELP